MLQCSDDSLYSGVTTELQRRLDEHNNDNKKGARYTRSRRPVRLVYTESCADRSTASQREYALKQLSRKQKIEMLNLPAQC